MAVQEDFVLLHTLQDKKEEKVTVKMVLFNPVLTNISPVIKEIKRCKRGVILNHKRNLQLVLQ
jgi:hypothetical protein